MKRIIRTGSSAALVFFTLCAGTAFGAGMDNWVTAKVNEAAAMPAGPAGAKLSEKAPSAAALLSSFKGVTAASPSSPVALLNEPANQIWETTSGGERFLVHIRPDDVRPFLRVITGLPPAAGGGFDAAKALVLEKVLGGDATPCEVSASRTPVTRSEAALKSGRADVAAPWETCWIFFVDDAPRANWGHDCRYVFVAPDLSAVAVQYARMPLAIKPRAEGNVPSLEVVIPYSPPKAEAQSAGEETEPPPPLNYAGDASRCYAVIISGGANQSNNHIRYWGDAAFIYSTLTLTYGYNKNHIYVLVSDGTDPAVDRSDGTNSPTDLDGDGLADTAYSAVYTNVQTVFNELASILTAGDQLFVFTTDHGNQVSGWAAYLNLWNWEELHDYQLKAMTKDLPCPVIFAMEQCFSGGFLDDLNQPNRCIATAAPYDASSYAGDTYPDYDQWCYYWTAGMRGFKPGAYPWLNGAAVNADANGDGRVSFKEAYDFAYANKYPDDLPQYQSNPPALGDDLYLNQVPTPTPTPTPTPPIDLTANKTAFSTAGSISVSANVSPLTVPCHPFVRILMPDGTTQYYQSGAGFTGSPVPYLGFSAGTITTADPIMDYPALSANFSGIPTGTYYLEGGAVDATKTTSADNLVYWGRVDRETLEVR